MSSRALAAAVAFLALSIAFAAWAHHARTARRGADEPAGRVVEPATSEPASRAPSPTMQSMPGGYSIDAAPNSIVGHVPLAALEGAARGDFPTVEFVHARGRRVRVPVAMTGFFGAGALEDGAWTVRCTTPGFWIEERSVELGPSAPRADIDFELVKKPRLELTLRTAAEKPSRPGVPLQLEGWIFSARLVATRERPGEELGRDVLDEQPVKELLRNFQDDVAGGVRTMLFDADLALELAGSAWISFVVEDRVVVSSSIDRATKTLSIEVGEAELSRALGSLDVRVNDVERGAPISRARLTLLRSTDAGVLGSGRSGVLEFAGTTLVPHIVAGPHALLVEAEGRERQVLSVEVRPGERAIVEVRLGPETRVRGRLVDGAGKGLAAQLELAPLDEPEPLLRLASLRTVKSDTEGQFSFTSLPAAAWVVRSADVHTAFAPLVVDTRNEKGAVQGAVDGLAIQATRGVLVTLVRPLRANEQVSAGAVRLVDSSGLVACERRGREFMPTTNVRVVPGRYRVRWEDEVGALRERELVAIDAAVRLELE